MVPRHRGGIPTRQRQSPRPLQPPPPSSPRTPRSPGSPHSPLATHAHPQQRSQFFMSLAKTSPNGDTPAMTPGAPETGGVIYRPHACLRAAKAGRHHWRTKSDTFSLNPPKVEVSRKRSRDDSECDSLPFDER
ncbi:proline-rich protein 2-like isoform X2 [Scylla paramamosain]